MTTAIVQKEPKVKKFSDFGGWFSFHQQRNQRTKFLTKMNTFGAARENPESRFATRALGTRADLGITAPLELGASVRPLDDLINVQLDLITSLSRSTK